MNKQRAVPLIVLGLLVFGSSPVVAQQSFPPGMPGEVVDYFKTPEGAHVLERAKDLLREESDRNRRDPALVEYYASLKAKDYVSAFRSIQNAAAVEHPVAMGELGFMYSSGYPGVEYDFDKAKLWLERSAERGHVQALSILGFLHLMPKFGRQDVVKAASYYDRCAMQLRLSCFNGMAGTYMVESSPIFNLSNALAWAELGVQLGVPNALERTVEDRGALCHSEWAPCPAAQLGR
jgi:hypothetical protein